MMDTILAKPDRPQSTQEDVTSLVQQIQKASTKLHTPEGVLDDNSRKSALALAKQLVNALEKPEDVVMRYAFEVGTHCMCLRLGVDLRIFHILVQHDGVALSASRLAELTKAESLFIVRIMRVISLLGFALEVDEQSYVATPLTTAFTIPALEAGMKACYGLYTPVHVQTAEHFRTRGYKCPTDTLDCPFQWTYDTDLSYFGYLHQNPEKLKDFETFLSANGGTRKYWIEWFPVESEILADTHHGRAAEKNENENEALPPLVVDVGGNKGHDLERFLARFPQAKGRLVLQDLQSTIDNIQDLSPGIQAMPHDFFAPQPVKGARVYYLHFILHDWPDDKCREILQSIKKAMKVGYSKILINEAIVPSKNCGSWLAATDINMMTILAGMERASQQWIDLLESVGLKVVKIWNSPHDGEEAIIEATL